MSQLIGERRQEVRKNNTKVAIVMLRKKQNKQSHRFELRNYLNASDE